MPGITTHILDVSIGRPAAGVAVKLDRQDDGGEWQATGTGRTDDDGRARDLLQGDLSEGVYRLTFDIGQYFSSRNIETFFPEVTITFRVNDASQHYHVPLLLSPFGYSTYRGS